MKTIIFIILVLLAVFMFNRRQEEPRNISRESVKEQADECVRRGFNFDQCKEYLIKEGFKK